MDVEEFRRFGHAIIDWVADYRGKTRLGELPVMARVAPGAIGHELPAEPPLQPEPFESVLQDLTQLILPACTHSQDPRFFGYFPSVSSPAAVLGDYAATGLAQLGINWQASPALTELEDVTIGWLRQMLGLSPAWSGVFQDTATTGTLVALLSARERSTGYCASRGGLQECERPLIVYASSQSHESVSKAVRLAGFGSNNLRLVAVDGSYAMRADALKEMIQSDRARGLQPCAVVATTGTADTTALDPLAGIAAVTSAEGLWLHVDAAMAGSAMILPECRWMWAGVEQGDSIVFNPHKWLGASFDCSVYWVRDADHLLRVMSINSGYLRTRSDSRVKSYRDWGIPLSRSHRALKIWFLVREQGVSGLQARIRRDIGHAKWLADEVDATSGWRRLAPSPLQTVCVRHEPSGSSDSMLDTHTLAWVCRINESGRAYLTPARLDGRWMVRVAFGSEATEHHHVAELWRLMRAEASWPH
jgi:aromatic-L-amino-acid decarboxylase